MTPLDQVRNRSLNIVWVIAIACLSFFAVNGQDTKPTPSTQSAKTEIRERRTGAISGTVSDDGGHPISNANVLVSPLAGAATSRSEGTDENGKFTVKDLNSGAYRIIVQSPAYVQIEDDIRGPDGSPKLFRTGQDINLTLEKGGVITGTVTDQSGAPLVGINVTAIRIQQPGELSFSNDSVLGIGRATDDRGIYRIYGLRTGRYLVFTGTGRSFSPRPGPFDRDAPTYYPNSSRDTASSVTVQTGQETAGIDVRYRGERGYTISGTLTGVTEKFALLSLMMPENSTPLGIAYSREQDGQNAFVVSNVPNGQYKVVAFSNDDKSGRSSTGTINVSVKNGDVEGLSIRLDPLSSISGRFVLTSPFEPKCNEVSGPGLEQAVISAIPEKKPAASLFTSRLMESGASVSGEFSLRSLSLGNYRIRTFLPTADWYIRSIEGSSERSVQNSQLAKTTGLPLELVQLTSGGNVAGLKIDLANGAGSVEGHVRTTVQSPDQASIRRVYLVPSEKERADDTLRFSESAIETDGVFSFRNLAPGHYFLVTKTLKENESIRPIYWDPKERYLLVANAVSSGIAVDVKPCQSISDIELKFGPDGMIK